MNTANPVALPRAASTPRAYTVPQFLDHYCIGRSFFYAEVRAGRLKIRKAGRRSLVSTEDAEAWFNALPEHGDAS